MSPWYLLDSSLECICILDPMLPQGFGYEEDLLTEQLSFAAISLEFNVPASHPHSKGSEFVLHGG
jgi:hypothetical protein